MSNLQNAKNSLAQVGGYLTKAKSEMPENIDYINELLSDLKKANTKINNLISGSIGVDFSFDEDVTMAAPQKRVQENTYGGVDLGGFEDMISSPQDNGEWKRILESTKNFSGVSLKGVNFDQELFDGYTLVDQT